MHHPQIIATNLLPVDVVISPVVDAAVVVSAVVYSKFRAVFFSKTVVGF